MEVVGLQNELLVEKTLQLALENSVAELQVKASIEAEEFNRLERESGERAVAARQRILELESENRAYSTDNLKLTQELEEIEGRLSHLLTPQTFISAEPTSLPPAPDSLEMDDQIDFNQALKEINGLAQWKDVMHGNNKRTISLNSINLSKLNREMF